MKKIVPKKFLIFSIIQIVIFITSLLYYNKITLLHYINISFSLSAALMFISLFLYITQTGFYDAIFKSFSIVSFKDQNKKKLDDVTPLSKLITLKYKPFLIHGLLIGACMLTALIIYYI